MLDARGILFVPDYTVNSGGIINGFAEGAGYDAAAVRAGGLTGFMTNASKYLSKQKADGTFEPCGGEFDQRTADGGRRLDVGAMPHPAIDR